MRRYDARFTYRHPAGRALSLGVGLGALAAALALGGRGNRVTWAAVALPDTALLIGIAAAPTFERLPPYAVTPYNVLHSPAIPAVLLGAALLGRDRRLVPAGLGWLAHLGWDRAWGYGPRGRDGRVR